MAAPSATLLVVKVRGFGLFIGLGAVFTLGCSGDGPNANEDLAGGCDIRLRACQDAIFAAEVRDSVQAVRPVSSMPYMSMTGHPSRSLASLSTFMGVDVPPVATSFKDERSRPPRLSLASSAMMAVGAEMKVVTP